MQGIIECDRRVFVLARLLVPRPRRDRRESDNSRSNTAFGLSPLYAPEFGFSPRVLDETRLAGIEIGPNLDAIEVVLIHPDHEGRPCREFFVNPLLYPF